MWWWGPCAGASCCVDVVVPKCKRAAFLYDELVPLLTDGRESLEASEAQVLRSRSASSAAAITPGIYRARDVRTHDAVALKVFAKTVLQNATKRRRIRQEIHVLSLCGEHANILRLYGVYSSKRTFEIAFELASGGEVLQRIAGASDAAWASAQHERQSQSASAAASEALRYRITEHEISRVVASAASALRFMHAKGIIHGEVRPEHLLYTDLEPDARVVLADFGRAAAWRDFTFRSRVRRRQFMWHDAHCTKFLPPFVLARLSDASAVIDGCTSWKQARHVDVWSLGVTMYVLLCGAFPFDGITLEEIRSRILTQPVIFPTSAPSRSSGSSGSSTEQEETGVYLSRAAKDLLLKLLEKNPELAPSMDEVCEHPWLSADVAANVRWSDTRLDEFGSFAESYARDVAASSLRRRTGETSTSYGRREITPLDPMEYDVFGIGDNSNERVKGEEQEDDDDGSHDEDEFERPSFVSTDGVPKSDAYEERLSADAYMRLASAELESVAARKTTSLSPRLQVNIKSPKPRKSRAPAAAAEAGNERDEEPRPQPVANIRGDFWPVFSKQRRLMSLQSLSFRSGSSGSKDD